MEADGGWDPAESWLVHSACVITSTLRAYSVCFSAVQPSVITVGLRHWEDFGDH